MVKKEEELHVSQGNRRQGELETPTNMSLPPPYFKKSPVGVTPDINRVKESVAGGSCSELITYLSRFSLPVRTPKNMRNSHQMTNSTIPYVHLTKPLCLKYEFYHHV